MIETKKGEQNIKLMIFEICIILKLSSARKAQYADPFSPCKKKSLKKCNYITH